MEKLLPEMPIEIWAKRLPDGAIYDAHGNADRDATRYIRSDLATPAPSRKDAVIPDPDMPSDQLRLHMGELSSSEILVARAAIRWTNALQPVSDACKFEGRFTREELTLSVIKNLKTYYGDGDAVLAIIRQSVQVLIDMGAIKVKP